MRLRDLLIAATSRHVLGSVGEKPVDDESDDWEEEDTEDPEQFMERRTA